MFAIGARIFSSRLLRVSNYGFVLFLFLLAGLIALGAPLWAQDASYPKEFQLRESTSSGGETLKHVVYVPRNLEPGKKYPLVVYLHGRCDVCITNERIMQETGLRWWHQYDLDVETEPTFLVAPVGGIGGWSSPARSKAVFEIVDGLLSEFPIDRQRIYLMGFSMGGMGIWNYLQQRPGFFAAANPQGGPAYGLDPELVKNTPIWATIGINDDAKRLELLESNVASVRLANGDPNGAATWDTGVNPRLSIFADTDHGGAQEKTQQIPGLREWFYAQSTNGHTPPNVRFVRPLPLDQEYTAPVTALVSAAAPNGTIDRVEFLLGDKVAFIAHQEPFEYTFTGLAPGTYTLGARAVESGGKSSKAEVTIRVGTPSK
ncbi:MAG: Ig-like domain-containing protein [Terracidiphilus sp.]|jgi:pimeloyl-ACP methyl ester carboxylesterase